MEIHHHPNHEHGRKSWKSYLWEFAMLFLAVFSASAAEYWLEHKIERDKEKQYIQSLSDDLAVDTTNLARSIKNFDNHQRVLDTTLNLYGKLAKGYNDTLLRNLGSTTTFVSFMNTDRTIQQLKNSGAMRLIHKQDVALAIMDYDSKMRSLQSIALPILQDLILHDLKPHISSLLDMYSVKYDNEHKTDAEIRKENKTYLLSTDRVQLAQLYNSLNTVKYYCLSIRDDEKDMKKRAADLIVLLKKEYSIK